MGLKSLYENKQFSSPQLTSLFTIACRSSGAGTRFACRLLKTGVTAAMHNHLPLNPADCENEYSQALNAYADTGLRVFFCPGVRNTHPLIYGDNQAFLSSLPDHARQYWAAR